MDVDRLWSEAAAAVQGDLDAYVVEEAHEVFLAEAARTRLLDRRGTARIALRGGGEVRGVIVEEPHVLGHVALRDPDGTTSLVALDAIGFLTGSEVRLRPETGASATASAVGDAGCTLASWLREEWQRGSVLHVLDRSGSRWAGRATFVGADHAELDCPTGLVVLPYAAVDCWSTPPGRA